MPTQVGGTVRAGSEPIPGYHIEARLGAGQFGEVWKARSPGDAQVALKFLPLGGAHGWKEFRAVQRVKQVRHPNLMPIIAIWLVDEDGEVISDDVLSTLDVRIDETAKPKSSLDTLVIEPVRESRKPAQMIIANLLADKTLGDRLKECQAKGLAGIPQQELLRYMEEAAKGLDFLNSSLHQIGDSQGSVQHCDVKPDNIMLTGGSAIVSDFGVAQMMAEANTGVTATSLGGTPAYMAPECFESKTSPGTDQYALAVTYYELRTGKLPFQRQTYAAVYEAHRTGSLDFSAISEGERAVLKKATSPAPERRYASCLEFVTALREAGGLYPRGRSTGGKRAVGFLLLAGASVIAAMGLAFALWPASRHQTVERIDKRVREGDYTSAVALILDLPEEHDMTAGLALSVEQLDKEAPSRQVDNGHLISLMSLLSGVRSSSNDIDPKLVDRLGRHVEQQLELRVQEIRDKLDAWGSNGAQSSNAEEIFDRIKNLKAIFKKKVSLGLTECEQFRTSVPVLNVRLMAREELAPPELEFDEQIHELIERKYAAALRFILTANLNEAEDRHYTPGREQVARRLQDRLALEDDLGGFQLAPWERKQIETEFEAIDSAIHLEWLADKEFRELVRNVGAKILPQSYEVATDPVKHQLKQVATLRQKRQFPEAWKLLAVIQKDVAKESRDRARDEEALLTLLDPNCPPRRVDDLLINEMERLRKLAKGEDSIIVKDADQVRAAVISALEAECSFIAAERPGEALPQLPQGLDASLNSLVATDFESYARYVRALSLAHQAQTSTGNPRGQIWEEASRELKTAYELPSHAPLETADRKLRARSVLVDAFKCWSGERRPTDADYGRPDIFGNWPRQAYENLLLARRLQPVSDDLLLCAAVAAWDEIVNSETPSLVLPVSKALLKTAKSDSRQDLLGTIYCAQCKALAIANADPEAQLESATNALPLLYPIEETELKGGLQPEQMERLWRDLVEPMLPLADGLWKKHEQSPDRAGSAVANLGQFYREAGFLLREDRVAEKVRLTGKYEDPNKLACLAMERANRVRPAANSLIVEGRILCELESSDPNWLSRLADTASRAVEAAKLQKDKELMAQALALQSYAHLKAARDERRPLKQRLSNFDEALEHVKSAIALQAAVPEKLPEYGEWLGNRSTIEVERACIANESADKRESVLRKAADDAEEATALKLQKKYSHYPYLAWGDALEDLAFYLWIDPERNYELACEKFEKSLGLTHPGGVVSLHYADHLSSLMSLVRCRNRWVSSGVLNSKEEELELLQKSIDDIERSLLPLDPKDATEDLTPRIAETVAELLYWRSEIYRMTALRSSGEAREAAVRSALQDIAWAVQWAFDYELWVPWADYQLVLAARQSENGNVEAAARICREVLDLERQRGVALPPHNLCTTVKQLLSYNAALKKVWSADDWDVLLARFTAPDPVTKYCNTFLQVLKIPLSPEPIDSDIGRVDALVGAIRIDELPRQDDLEVKSRWAAYKAQRALELAGQAVTKNDRRLAISHSEDRSVYSQEVLAAKDAAASDSLKQALTLLRTGERTWSSLRLPVWEKRQLSRHLESTFDARRRLVDANFALLRVAKAPLGQKLNPGELRQTAQEHLRLLNPEITKDYQTANWANEYKEVEFVVFGK